jgi:hypothetical protein
VEDLAGRATRHAPRVTLLGQVKAGKTALANALAGHPGLLPTDVNPWTTAVTALHLNQPWRTHAAVFEFFGREDWDALVAQGGALGALARRTAFDEEAAALARQVAELRARAEARLGRNFEKLVGGRHSFDRVDPGLLRRYVCAGDAGEDAGEGDRAGRFAELTRRAGLSLASPCWAGALTITDTPGINDPFLLRERMTLDVLGDTDACVVVLSAHQAMTLVDVALLRLISALAAGRTILFVNRVDELADPAAQTAEIAERVRGTLRAAGTGEDAPLIFGSAVTAGDPGVLALRREIAGRLAAGSAVRPLLDIAAAGRDLAQQALAARRAALAEPSLDEAELADRLDALVKHCRDALDGIHGEGWRALRQALGQTVERFAEAECGRLADALEAGGHRGAWSADAAALRRQMRETYFAAAGEMARAVDRVLGRMSAEIGLIYRDLLGGSAPAPEPPRAPEVPQPVAIARGMTIDADIGWWRRLLGGGRRIAVERLRQAIRMESVSLVEELGTAQVGRMSREAKDVSGAFLETHAATLFGILAAQGGDARRAWPGGTGSAERGEARLEAAERELARLAMRLGAEEPA